MQATKTVLNFRDALLASHSQWNRTENGDLSPEIDCDDAAFDDWAQCHWELLVERVICTNSEFLRVYGAGSDYEAAIHSRVFFHDATPTHEITCSSDNAMLDVVNGNSVDDVAWQFDRFVTMESNWYKSEPPFDHVLLTQRDSEKFAVVFAEPLRFTKRMTRNAV